jgi:predicted oxidoreductase
MKFSNPIFGTMNLGHKYSDPREILLRIKECLALGITTFDLADIYGGYTYEELFGKALTLEPSLRSQMQIVTKCDILANWGELQVKVKHYDTSKEYILRSVERSLTKIGTDFVDLLLIHRPDPLMNADDIADAFRQLKSEGKVLNFGVSNFTPSQFDLVQSRLDFPLVTNQVEFSVTHLAPMYDGTFDQMQRLSIQPMIWSALSGGRIFSEKSVEMERIVAALSAVAKELGSNVTIDQVVYAWINTLPCKPVIILGTLELDRIKSAVNGVKLKLDRVQWFTILEAIQGRECP